MLIWVIYLASFILYSFVKRVDTPHKIEGIFFYILNYTSVRKYFVH